MTSSGSISSIEARACTPPAAPSGCSPGGNPGQHLSTENIRAQLVQLGIRPSDGRKAALFQLVAEVPAPVLAELVGLTNSNAARWAQLAGRDWRDYIAARTH